MSENIKEKANYTREDLEKAILSVKSGNLSSYKAEKSFGVPRSTILNHVSGKTKGFAVGRPRAFNSEQERLIVDFVITLSEYGYPPDRFKMKKIATNFAEEFNLKIKNDQKSPENTG